ncbi:MAG TPA: glycosyltransferase family 2 protein [Candidatus Acidoferrales bacterium]|nr:glycosyltransferase family 2 protein [Candidatus Acidoferrales bacterium]
MKQTISIVIPAFNEERVILKLTTALIHAMNALPQFEFETIIVEHGSTDDTFNQLLKARKKDKRIKILKLAKNVGCDGGIIAGLTYATGDAAIVMMADLQDNPNAIPQFIKKWQEGYHVVYAVVTKRPHVKFYKQLGALIFYKIMNYFSNGLMPENVSDFRLMDKSVYRALTAMPEHNKFFRGLVAWSGFRQTGIPVPRAERAAGEPKSDFRTLFKVASNGIISFSNFPLRIPWLFSVLFFLGGVIALLFTNTLISILLFSFAFLMIVMGIQGEYIARIFEETRKRPNFIVQELHGLKI